MVASNTCLFNLNTNGASKGSLKSSSREGVIIDSLGYVLVAFSNLYGKNSSLVLEARALLDYLQLEFDHGITHLDIELDSLILTSVVRNSKSAWMISQLVRQNQSIILEFTGISST
ncbi:hypothetical protein ACH5RR_003051 [Cinchona calisaya]|uniref:RNase H type-1 domain-containing protein n=1 Tax=Cinchona calisaya TaxID=153742 RepID=A0ABD3ATU8_9GENT